MTTDPRPTIVLVADELLLLTVLALTFRQYAQEYDLIPVQGGVAALAFVARRAVALVITDDHMPTLDGVALMSGSSARRRRGRCSRCPNGSRSPSSRRWSRRHLRTE